MQHRYTIVEVSLKYRWSDGEITVRKLVTSLFFFRPYEISDFVDFLGNSQTKKGERKFFLSLFACVWDGWPMVEKYLLAGWIILLIFAARRQWAGVDVSSLTYWEVGLFLDGHRIVNCLQCPVTTWLIARMSRLRRGAKCRGWWSLVCCCGSARSPLPPWLASGWFAPLEASRCCSTHSLVRCGTILRTG